MASQSEAVDRAHRTSSIVSENNAPPGYWIVDGMHNWTSASRHRHSGIAYNIWTVANLSGWEPSQGRQYPSFLFTICSGEDPGLSDQRLIPPMQVLTGKICLCCAKYSMIYAPGLGKDRCAFGLLTVPHTL